MMIHLHKGIDNGYHDGNLISNASRAIEQVVCLRNHRQQREK